MKQIDILLLMIPLIPCAAYCGSIDKFDMDRFLGFRLEDQRGAFRENPKTLFQTNLPYDERISIPVDGVIYHQHGTDAKSVQSALKSWQDKGYLTQRMFFADSDAGWVYTRGKYDGKNHPGDIEKDQAGRDILCAGVRPYMLPTEGWTRYLKTQVKCALDGGATAIYPEEPLAHNHSGYEESFPLLYSQEYGTAWQGGHESPDAFFKTCQLKNKLYFGLEQQLCDYTKRYSSQKGHTADFLIPIHSMYSNLSARLVAPLGSSLSIKGHDGYIGQIWTGPVLWTLDHFSDKETRFFDSAYVLYNYFVNLVDRSDKKIYLLTDPVEDHPGRTWDDYEKWYKECVAAELLFGSVNTYEVMPWPDRIFLPGYQTGGGTPGPAHYRTIIMSVVSALQDMPLAPDALKGGTDGIGMLIGDSAMWQKRSGAVQDPHLSLLLPLLKQGIPVSSVPVERAGDTRYMHKWRMLLLSYDSWKPYQRQQHENLAAWVRKGGTLVLFDGMDSFDDIELFWKKEGYPNPQSHLISTLGIDYNSIEMTNEVDGVKYFHKPVGRGYLVVSRLSPETIATDNPVKSRYLNLIRTCTGKFLGEQLKEPEYLLTRRGDYVICHAFDAPYRIDGTFIKFFSADLDVVSDVAVEPNSSELLFDIEETLNHSKPAVLYSTYRLMGKREKRRETTFFVQGPAGTEGKVRVYTAGKTVKKIESFSRNGEKVTCDYTPDSTSQTGLVSFKYNPEGTGFKILWE